MFIIFNIRAGLIEINNIWITIDHDFDPVAPGESVNSGKNELANGTDHRWNSRIASVTISNYLVVVICGSIAFYGNGMVKKMTEADPNLEIAPPTLTATTDNKNTTPLGFGICDGLRGWRLRHKFSVFPRYKIYDILQKNEFYSSPSLTK